MSAVFVSDQIYLSFPLFSQRYFQITKNEIQITRLDRIRKFLRNLQWESKENHFSLFCFHLTVQWRKSSSFAFLLFPFTSTLHPKEFVVNSLNRFQLGFKTCHLFFLQIFDLLNKRKKLQVLEDGKAQVQVRKC